MSKIGPSLLSQFMPTWWIFTAFSEFLPHLVTFYCYSKMSETLIFGNPKLLEGPRIPPQKKSCCQVQMNPESFDFSRKLKFFLSTLDPKEHEAKFLKDIRSLIFLDFKGQLQRFYELMSYERDFKMLKNDMCITEIGQAVLEL